MAFKKRILVDMSATIIHHGHIRLLEKASRLGSVIVGLTSDEDLSKVKKIPFILNFNQRKEIISSIRYVDEVIESPWLISDEFLCKNNIDYLVHGSDNSNDIPEEKLILFPRTEGISSSMIREFYKQWD